MNIAEVILLAVNGILIFVAVFLFLRLRKLQKKENPGNKQQSEPEVITNINQPELTKDEFQPEKFGIKAQDIPMPEKKIVKIADVAAESIGIQGITELKLEDEPLEINEKQVKKEFKKKKPARKLLEIKEEILPGKIQVPEKIEEKKPAKKAGKKKPAKKGAEEVAEINWEPVNIPEKVELKGAPAKEKKAGKKEDKKKPAIKETAALKEETKEAADKKATKKKQKKK